MIDVDAEYEEYIKTCEKHSGYDGPIITGNRQLEYYSEYVGFVAYTAYRSQGVFLAMNIAILERRCEEAWQELKWKQLRNLEPGETKDVYTTLIDRIKVLKSEMGH